MSDGAAFCAARLTEIQSRTRTRSLLFQSTQDTTVNTTKPKKRSAALPGITRDISERKNAEETLRKERDFISAVLDTVGSMVLVLDCEGKIVRFNRTCEEVSGYSFPEVLGKHVWDFLIPPEQVDGVKTVFQNLTAGMFPNKYENFWIAKNGAKRLIAWSNTALLAGDGSVEYVIATGLDITERKLAEEALGQEKRFSDAIIDNLPGTFFICDEEGALIRWNSHEQETTGYSVEELSRMNVLQLFSEDHELLGGKMREVFASGRASLEARLITKSGTPIPFYITGFRMTMDDKRYLVGVGIDVSLQKKLEEQLRHAQKMESVGALAGGLAHDFNNILTAIIGYGHLLQLKMKDDDPLKHNVEQILASANRAANLTRSLLAYSRKQIMNPQIVDLNEIIKKVELLLARLLGEDIELKTILTNDSVTVLADAGQIEQVLMNLAANARDAMPDGGYLYIETERVAINEQNLKSHDVAGPGAYALISVTDSGLGMDEKTRERIFEPFFTTKETGRGSGLGLAMTYGIIKPHGGSIGVTSELGRGTTFKIYLPLVTAAASKTQPVELPPIEGGTETILVAEDDEDVRVLTCNALRQFGYTVIPADDGEDAVNKFMQNQDKVNLLLLDVIMPKKSGKEVYDKIRIFKPNVKALFLSGYTADIIHKKGLLEQDLDFLLKPIAINDLLRKVREILSRQ